MAMAAAAAEEDAAAAQSLRQALSDLVRAFVRPLKRSKLSEEVRFFGWLVLPARPAVSAARKKLKLKLKLKLRLALMVAVRVVRAL